MKFNRLLPRYIDNPDLSGSQGAADQSINTGKNAINSFDPTQITGAQKTNLGAGGLGGLLGGQTNSYVTKFANTIPGLYDTANTLYNVNPLREQANAFQNRLTNAVPDAYKGANGYDISSTDINNGIAAKTAYVAPQANAATNNYNTAAGLANTYVQTGLQPLQAEGSLLGQTEAAQASGWNQASQQELEGLIQKMQSGVQLSATEMARANQLSQLEESYQQALATAKIGQQFQQVAPGSNLVNTFANSIMNPSMLTARTGVATYGK